MFQIEIRLHSFQGEQSQQKNHIQQKLSEQDPVSIIYAKENSLNILRNDESVTIVSDLLNNDEANEYEIIYKEQEQQDINEQQDKSKIQIPQTQQENVAKSNESLQNLSFTSDSDHNDKDQQINNNKQNDNEKIGSSNTIESIQSHEDTKDNNYTYGISNLEATIVQSPLISEEETDDTNQKIYQNIQQLNVSKEQRNALYSAFNQASSYLKEINNGWVCDEEKKKQDLFNKNIFYNQKYQILALGLFSIYIFFL